MPERASCPGEIPPQRGNGGAIMRRAYEAREGRWGARWRFRIRCHGDRDRSPGLRLPQISRRLSSLVQDGRHRKTKGDCVRLKPPLALAAVGAGVGRPLPPPRERQRRISLERTAPPLACLLANNRGPSATRGPSSSALRSAHEKHLREATCAAAPVACASSFFSGGAH
ncbi:hypothetical protein HPB50_021141 [Hyalomma asiaticum]|uniref:Uncharacterized protein n=1 Tax=Hyalomma asiaticum TaxID=266040 RepID=A0ACB7TL29_HYAAI|nr:hypothetical protein HPB50_021141 [Hyalomma asiaticum]